MVRLARKKSRVHAPRQKIGVSERSLSAPVSILPREAPAGLRVSGRLVLVGDENGVYAGGVYSSRSSSPKSSASSEHTTTRPGSFQLTTLLNLFQQAAAPQRGCSWA